MSSFRIGYLIFIRLHICFVFVSFQLKLCASASENDLKAAETKFFQCGVNIFSDIKGNLTCIFSLSYQSGELDLGCITREQSGMRVEILKEFNYVARKNTFKDALKCKSDFPMTVEVSFQENEIVPLTQVTQERLFRKYYDSSSYEYQLTIPLLNAETILLDGDAKTTFVNYKIIAESPSSVLEAGVLIYFGNYTTCETNNTNDQPLFSKSIFKIRAQQYLEIPVLRFVTEPFFIYRQICNAKLTEECVYFDDVPCFEIPKTSLRLEKESIIIQNKTFYGRIPLAKLLEATNITDSRLKVLINETLSEDYVTKLLKSIRTPEERLIIVDNEKVAVWWLMSLLVKLEVKINASCIPQKTLSYNELNYILQHLRIAERLIMENTSMFFNPLQGIMIKSEFLRMYGNGAYTVRAGNCRQTIRIYFEDHDFSPERTSLFPLFPMYNILNGSMDSGLLHFGCSSSKKNVAIVTKKEIWNDTWNYTFHNVETNDSLHKYQSNAVFQLKANFKSLHLKCSEIINSETWEASWSIYAAEGNEALQSKSFYYFVEGNSFVCSALHTVKARKWNCKNRLQCQITKSKCLGDDKDGDAEKDSCMQSLVDARSQPCSEIEEQGAHFKKDAPCVATKADERGIVQCFGSSNGIGIFDFHYVYFRGFDGRIYIESEMKSAPPIDAILKISSLNSSDGINSVKGKHIFRCEAHSYFYEDGIQWFLKFQNETIIRLVPGSIGQQVIDKQMSSNNFVSEIKLNITDLELIEIICSAPIFATTRWHNISTVFGKPDHITHLYMIIGLCLAPIILSVILYFICLRIKEKLCFPCNKFVNNYLQSRINEMKKYRELEEVINLLKGGNQQISRTDDDDGIYRSQIYCPFNEQYEIAKNSFLIDRSKILGRGEFGEVYKGLLNGMDRTVAFKTVKPNCTYALKALASEAKILMYIGEHENVVKLLGVYREEIQSGILHVAIEYCELGSMEKFLLSNGHLFSNVPFQSNAGYTPNGIVFSFDDLIKWSEQIASGMEYLGTKKVIHKDLAARNVLLTSEQNAKVTDFGLSLRIYNYSEYVKIGSDPMPWRWSAIESLKTNKYSSKSDVWSFGVTLWEIFSLGDVPYPGMEYSLEFVQKLEEGLRNTKPKEATEEIYKAMSLCWSLDPEERPTFSTLKLMLSKPYRCGRAPCTINMNTSPKYVEISAVD